MEDVFSRFGAYLVAEVVPVRDFDSRLVSCRGSRWTRRRGFLCSR